MAGQALSLLVAVELARQALGPDALLLVDNVLRLILVGKDTQMPDYIVLISTIGGMAIFGLNGFVIGPLVAAMFRPRGAAVVLGVMALPLMVVAAIPFWSAATAEVAAQGMDSSHAKRSHLKNALRFMNIPTGLSDSTLAPAFNRCN